MSSPVDASSVSDEEHARHSSVGQPWQADTADAAAAAAPAGSSVPPPLALPEGSDSSSDKNPNSAVATIQTAREVYLESCNDKAILFCLCIGLKSEDGERKLGDLTEDPYSRIKKKNQNKLKVQNAVLAKEVVRRGLQMCLT
ncbi:hypothetical protein (Partial), partial [Seminavis robusta]|eukprot:Sro152_g069340.1 n/a (141) ;mRNA; r:98-521